MFQANQPVTSLTLGSVEPTEKIRWTSARWTPVWSAVWAPWPIELRGQASPSPKPKSPKASFCDSFVGILQESNEDLVSN